MHDRELEALAGVHGEDLYGCRVGVEPPAALDHGVALGLLATPAQPRAQRGQAELALQRGLVQRLGDVPQVGEQPLAADLAEQPLLQPLRQRHRLEQRRDASLVEHPDPLPEQLRERVGFFVAALGQVDRGQPDEAAQRQPAYPSGPVRLLERLQQQLPLVRGRRC